MKLLILIRGAPGSGKTALAESIIPCHIAAYGDEQVNHFEADMFFTDKDTHEYHFDHTRLQDAHDWCQQSTEQAMKDGVSTIIVSNCFIKQLELNFYREAAKDYEYKIQEIICVADFGSVHGVPIEKVARMRANLES